MDALKRQFATQATPRAHRARGVAPTLAGGKRPGWRGWLRHSATVVILVLALAVMTACGGAPKPENSANPPQLYIYNWEDYFAPTTLEDFGKEMGIEVSLDTFQNEDEMLAGLQSRPGHYDVVFVADYLVAELVGRSLLEPLTLENIPNIKHVDSRFLDLGFDPGNKYSVPYVWGTTALAVNTAKIPENYDTWEVMWDPAYAGHIAMINDPQEVLGATLKLLGHSLNSRDPEHLAQAREKMLEQKPLLAGYMDSISIRDKLITGEIWAAQVYNGEGVWAKSKNPDVVFLVPNEGAAIWQDNMAIPLGAPHKAEAQKFLNYIQRPEVAAANSSYLYYANTNVPALELTPPEILQDPAVYPDKASFERSEYYLERTQEFNEWLNRMWSELTGP